MNDIEAWLEQHDEALSEIAHDNSLETGLVHLSAILVLAGLDNIEVLDQLVGMAHSLNGSRDPLAGAPDAIEAVRHLVSSSP